MRSCIVATLLTAASLTAEPLRVSGSTTVNPVVAEAAEILRAENGLTIHVDTQGGSSGGLHALGEGRIDVAMSSRPLNDADHRKFPAIDFQAHRIGADAVALIVSKDVWDSGIRSLSCGQMRKIYERKARKWSDFGGPDRRIAFFNKEPGRGTWEVFANWLYGKAENAPAVAHLEVGANEEARNKVAGTRGALSQLSASWVDGKTTFALGITNDHGKTVRPTAEHITVGDYPLSRSLWVVTDGPPRGDAKALIDFLLGERGQKLVRKHGYLTLADLEPVQLIE